MSTAIEPSTSVDDDSWELTIRPERSLLDVGFREIWAYRDLMWMFVRRDVVTVYKQTILGPIWYFAQPLLTMAIYMMVFSNIANISTDGIPSPLFYLSGIVMWNYFADTFKTASTTFSANAHIFGKVYFPRLIVPLSIVLSGLIKFLIQFSLFLIAFLYFWLIAGVVHPNFGMTLSALLVILMAGMGLGFGIIFSSLTTKYRDLNFLLQFGIQLLMYATPIIYPMSTLTEKMRSVLWWNPISHIIEAFKFGFLGVGEVSVAGLVYTTTFTIVTLFVGIVIFNRTEQNFMDTV